ncbi:uncharacterized protein [Diadema antillarum]|uniref:uncharacterized protein n=1 Tax=Diadema antillarum TaxID=105358 RepID=UPI003A846F94
MEFMIQQVLLVCPHVSLQDAERDLLITNDPQKTINRIFDGHFLEGAPSHIEDRGPHQTLSSPSNTPACPEAETTLNAVQSSSTPGTSQSAGEIQSLAFDDITVREEGNSMLPSKFTQRPEDRLKPAHGKASPISISSSDDNDHEEDALPEINFSSSATLHDNNGLSLSSPGSREYGQSMPLKALSQKATSESISSRSWHTEGHTTIPSTYSYHDNSDSKESHSDRDSITLDSSGSKMVKQKQPKTICLDSDSSSSSDEEEHLQLGLLQRLHQRNKTLSAGETGTSQDDSLRTGSPMRAKKAMPMLPEERRVKSVKDVIFGKAASSHDVSDSEESITDVADDSSERSCSTTCTDRVSSVSTVTKSYDSQAPSSQDSCALSSAIQRRPRRTPEEVAAAKMQALERKMAKDRQRQERTQLLEEKKQQKLREAEQRKMMRDAKKAERPEECLKHLTAVLDTQVIEDSGGAQILSRLQALGCKYVIEAQAIPSCISWRRSVMEANLGEDIELGTLMKTTEEREALVIVPVEDFVEMVHAFKAEQRGEGSPGDMPLSSHVTQLQVQLGGVMPTLVVQGMEKYFRSKKNASQRQYRNAVLGVSEDERQRGKKRKRKPEDVDILVSRVEVEEALVDLQIRLSCNVRLVETADQLADLIAMFTKAVAETPFKRKRDAAKFSFHVHTNWAGGVRVTKDGQGLLKVWKQQFMQFRNVSPEIASAVVSQYPSPQLLMQAYKRCPNEDAAKKLLQDIVVRRGEGVLATSRRVGPELSKRVYNFFTSRDGEMGL